jgi:triacylglycerol lipase
MKRVLANAFATCFGRVTFIAACAIGVAATGCSGTVPGSVPPPTTGGNDDPTPRGGTTWPTGSTSPTPTHRAYPLVLAHGFSGFHNIGPINYFYGVQGALAKDGHEVYVTTVDPYNSSEVRGAQLLAQVEQILYQSGAEKLNLICHSQGGLDCRYVANKLGAAKIGAVVMVAGTHRGSYVADVAAGVVKGAAADAMAAIMQILGDVLDPSGQPSSDGKAALAQLTSAGAAAFNAKYPDAAGVAYYSIGGRTQRSGGDFDCGSDTTAPFIGKWDQVTSPVNPLLSATANILDSESSIPPTNDGMVEVSSTKWGTFWGCVPADHFSEVCQIAGQSSGSSFNCVTLYRDIADWLVAHGF